MRKPGTNKSFATETCPPQTGPRLLRRGFRMRTLSVFSVLSVLSVLPLHAQFFAFGQNKIQYRVMKGPHVDLYY
jgi:hypothetical protein